MEKIEYSNYARWPENLNVLERYVIQLIKNQNEIIDKLKELEERLNN